MTAMFIVVIYTVVAVVVAIVDNNLTICTASVISLVQLMMQGCARRDTAHNSNAAASSDSC